MGEFSYLTVDGTAEGLYKEKGSKFMAFVFPVSSETEAKHHLVQLRKRFYDARHHCFAWVIGHDKSRYRVSDDGEPNHSAGDPILGQLKSKGLTNVLAVVVRYFGGTKLGVGGLITAYRSATQDALSNAVIVEKEIVNHVTLTYNYTYTSEAMRLIKDFDMNVRSQDFQTVCVLHTTIKVRFKAAFEEKIKLLNATGIPIKVEL